VFYKYLYKRLRVWHAIFYIDSVTGRRDVSWVTVVNIINDKLILLEKTELNKITEIAIRNIVR